ncbi:flagellar basal-body rod protein FlgF [Rhodoblastus acidophilus]|uniref:Flagellar basal-body rod protein FlgF n=1 Tax=Rhodoblastus acidophilus TaxID=1074 RepID=A0A6N8DM36_RHOAC|nr:flagellar basal-body rod protein FlgF [Rhodoblastus acidophilus]MCW2274949.1 flagellar basal-body rod protein FlgF [Rhodoblastus acidophilus]MTV31467.1 flagellar basal-body rod protein FlgF [Rhodoblastus acidophilus]
MQSSLYVTLSGQSALQKRLDTIAHNVANVNTAGFRAEEVSFSTLMSRQGTAPVAFAVTGDSFISRKTGEIQRTGDPLDVAVRGQGFFAIKTPDGVAYTRDGRLHMDATGALLTVNNYPILDAGGAGIMLDGNAGAPVIASDGMITQNGRQLGAVGLYLLDPEAKLTRVDNSAVKSDRPGTPVLDFNNNGVLQGMTEGSNVNPILEISRMINIQRTFESAARAVENTETNLNDAIKSLGSPNGA